MKVVAITGPCQCELVDRPDPKPAGEFVVIRNLVTPMCTEYKAYREGWRSDCLGHEAAGEVVEVAQACRVKPGDRVVVMPQNPCGKCALCLRGDYIHCEHCVDPLRETGSAAGTATYAQYMVKQDWLLVPIPHDISTEHASMACCGLGPTFGAMQSMNVGAYDTVLVTGLGPVGLGAVMNGACRGARVIGVDSNAFRADLARDLGAEVVVDPAAEDALSHIRDLTGGRGVDCAVDCSGVPPAQRLMLDAVRRRGRVAFVGEGGDLTIHVSNDLLRKGLTVCGQWHYNLADTPLMMDVVRRAGRLLNRSITHRFAMSRVRDAFDLQLTGRCGKVVLEPWA